MPGSGRAYTYPTKMDCMGTADSAVVACSASLQAQVAERGLKFVQSFAGLLTRRAELPQLFKEAWAFSACLALAGVATRMAPPPPTPNAAATGASGGTPIGLASSWRLHRQACWVLMFYYRSQTLHGPCAADSKFFGNASLTTWYNAWCLKMSCQMCSIVPRHELAYTQQLKLATLRVHPRCLQWVG